MPHSRTPSALVALAGAHSATPTSSVDKALASAGAASFAGALGGVAVAQLVPGDPGVWLGVFTGLSLALYFWRAYRVR